MHPLWSAPGKKCTPSLAHRGASILGPDKKLRFDYYLWPRFASLCRILSFGPIFCEMTRASAAWQTGANWSKFYFEKMKINEKFEIK
jgi:hypothetical protein